MHVRNRHSLRATAIIIAAAISLSACQTVQKYLGTDHDEEISDDAIAVLTLENILQADPRLANTPVNLPRAYENIQWPQPGGAPSNAMQHLQVEGGELRRIWRANGGTGNRRSTRMTAVPVIANGMIFALDSESTVRAIDVANGDRIWRQRLVPRGENRTVGFGGGIAHAGDRVVVTTGYGQVHALSETDGTLLWTRNVGVPIRTAPTVVSGRAFITTTDNQLLAIDVNDGTVLWNHRAFTESAGLLAATSPAANSDIVIAPFTSGELDAVRIQTGNVTWSDQLTRTGTFTPLANINAIAARPVIHGGRVYAVSHSGRFVAIDLRTGERIWTANIASMQTPWVVGSYIYVVTVDAEVICLSARDGRIRWITQLDQYEGRNERNEVQYVGPVLVSERLLVISSRGHLFELSPFTGEIRDETRLGDDVTLPPIVANNTLYIYTADGDIMAYQGREVFNRSAAASGQPRNQASASSSSQDDAEGDDGDDRGWFRWPSLFR